MRGRIVLWRRSGDDFIGGQVIGSQLLNALIRRRRTDWGTQRHTQLTRTRRTQRTATVLTLEINDGNRALIIATVRVTCDAKSEKLSRLG